MSDGGQAFSSTGIPAYSSEGLPLSPWAGYRWSSDPQPGMTLRDYFAAKALQGMLAHFEIGNTISNEALAKLSWEQADAMISARATGKEVEP